MISITPSGERATLLLSGVAWLLVLIFNPRPRETLGDEDWVQLFNST